MTLSLLSHRTRKALRSSRGAFDLPSILVGVVVVGVLTAGVLASFFGVIPFAQDSGARQDLSAYRTAEGVAKAKDGRFLDSAALSVAGYAQKTPSTAVGTDTAGTCYVGVARSGSGKMFFSTDRTPDPLELTSDSAPGCISWPALQAVAAAAGGTLPGKVASGAALAVWGDNWYGQFGNGTSGPGTGSLVPVDVPSMAGKAITTIVGGEDTFCAVADGDVYCAGQNSARSQMIPAMTKVNGFEGKTITALAAGRTSVCAIADGEAYCWGGGSGVLGSATVRSETPVKVAALAGRTVTELKSGASHTCAVSDGDVYCWGLNFDGQIGDGTTTDAPDAIKVLSGKSITSLSEGDAFFTCASGAGKTYCWGDNSDGQLGLGDTASRMTPTEVPALAGKKVTTITTSVMSVCAVVDGAVNCWGGNGAGGLGTGDAVSRSTPVVVPALAGKTITGLSTYGYSSCAVADADTYCWGNNGSGELGLGDTVDRQVPTKVAALAGKTVLGVATAEYSTLALIK